MPESGLHKSAGRLLRGKRTALTVIDGERNCYRLGLRLRLRTIVVRPIAALGHELIKLVAVLGEPKPLQEFLELALFVFEPAQRFDSIIVKGAVAAGWRGAPAIAAFAKSFHLGAEAIHFS